MTGSPFPSVRGGRREPFAIGRTIQYEVTNGKRLPTPCGSPYLASVTQAFAYADSVFKLVA